MRTSFGTCTPRAIERFALLGAKDKNHRDRALAATDRVHDFVLVTRNIDDLRGCGVRVPDPFNANPIIEIV